MTLIYKNRWLLLRVTLYSTVRVAIQLLFEPRGLKQSPKTAVEKNSEFEQQHKLEQAHGSGVIQASFGVPAVTPLQFLAATDRIPWRPIAPLCTAKRTVAFRTATAGRPTPTTANARDHATATTPRRIPRSHTKPRTPRTCTGQCKFPSTGTWPKRVDKRRMASKPFL